MSGTPTLPIGTALARVGRTRRGPGRVVRVSRPEAVRPITFVAWGLPCPKGSKTRMPNGAMLEGKSKKARARFAAWHDAVTAAAFDAGQKGGQFRGPTAVTIDFRFPRPKSRTTRDTWWHVVKPDKDKLARLVLDCLVDGRLLRDDACVCVLDVQARETLRWTGARITVERPGAPPDLA